MATIVDPPGIGTSTSADTDTLALLGKTQVLKRRFGFWSLLAFAICELITWETVLALFSQGLDNGGPAGLIYGFIIAWASTLSVYVVISELASIAPIASGQYHWVYLLAPKSYKKISSYVIGWLVSLAWIATIATESLFAGTMVQGILIVRYPEYNSKMWQGTLLTWAVIFVNVFINVVLPGLLPKFEIIIMVLHLAGFVAIMVTLLKTAEIGSASSVFLTVLNRGGWPTQGLSYCVGFLGNVATFVGADASVHMSEETENAAKNIPRAICTAMVVNGLVGFGMMITVLFCLGDIESVLNTKTEFPFIQIFVNSVNNIRGAVAMTAVVLVLTWCCALGIMTTASRMVWSFARDKGVPFSRHLARVDQRTRVPALSVGAVSILAALLTLIYIGSPTAFNDVISLTITGFYGSYFLPCVFLLYHRVKGHILPHETRLDTQQQDISEFTESAKEERADQGFDPDAKDNAVDVSDGHLVWGPWRVPGVLGTLNNAYACLYMIFVIFWSVWPPATPVTASTMNYAVVVTAGVIGFSIIWYYIRGRKDYSGPLIDEDVAPIMRRAGSVVAI